MGVYVHFTNKKNMEHIHLSTDFIDFIAKSPTKFHAIENIQSQLVQRGYTKLDFNSKWELTVHGKYFVTQDNSAIIAFEIGDDIIKKGIRLVCAHNDSPTFKIKPIAEINSSGNYLKLNIQAYAWPILTSWFDRPLSIAGRVSLKGKSIFTPINKLINFEEPILFIPNISILLNKTNSNNTISIQKEMLPIMSVIDEETDVKGYLYKIIAEKLNISPDDILEYELFLYPFEKGQLVGINKDFILTPRQDDLIMVYAAHRAFQNTDNKNDITKMIAFFDAEEETNATLGGADTPFLRNIITKIVKSINGDHEDIIELISNSFAVSLDSSHALHPNYLDKNDPTCSSVVNKGLVIKYDANMHYATTSITSAIFQSICKSKNIPFQKEAVNSDLRAGGTISAFLQTQVEMQCVEVGIPTFAMHSAYESCGSKDLYNLVRALQCFWSINE